MLPKHFLVMLCAFVFALVGCNATPTPFPTLPPPPIPTATPDTDPTWARIQSSKTWRIGTSANYAPFEYYNDQNKLDGFDIQLGYALAQQLGVNAVFTDFAFEGLGAAMQTNQIDTVMAAVSVTPQRQQQFDFSTVYFSGTDGVLAAPDSTVRVNSLDDFAKYRVGVQGGSVYETYLKQDLVASGKMLPTNVFVYADLNAALNDLVLKRIDVVWMDFKPAQDFAAQRSLALVDRDLYPQLYAIALPKNSPVLQQKINDALIALQNNGSLGQLSRQYLQTNIQPPAPLPTPVPNQPTPAPNVCADGMALVQDLSYDDRNMTAPPTLNPGQPFTKSWRVRNTGTCAWQPGYVLSFARGNNPSAQMNGQPAPVANTVSPGQTYDFNVNMVAPFDAGMYQGFWQMKNASGVPFGQTLWVYIQVAAPPTALPPPTQTPAPFIQFNANPTTVNQGQPVNFSWNAQNMREVYFYHDGQDWRNHSVPTISSAVDYPAQSMNYFLRVVQNNNETQTRQIFITVNAVANAPEIRQFNVQPSQLLEGQCVQMNWEVRGQVSNISINKNGQVLWNGAPLSGNLKDCPAPAGQFIYTLNANGPGGSNSRGQSVLVMGQSPQQPLIRNFTVSPESIVSGQCALVQWTTDTTARNITLRRQGPDGQVIVTQNALPSDGVQECIAQPSNYTYILQATPSNGGTPQTAEAYLRVLIGAEPR